MVPSLAGGGAERICVSIIRNIDRKKFEPGIILFEKRGSYLQEIREDVVIYDLKKKNRFDFLKLLRLSVRIFSELKPDIVISFLSYANFINVLSKILSFPKIPGKIIISERNYSSIYLKYERMRKIKEILLRVLYRRAGKVVVIAEGIKEDLINTFRIPHEKIIVIYNGIDVNEIEKLGSEPVNSVLFNDSVPIVIACGSLTFKKNFSFLLYAFSEVLKVLDAKLIIMGEGEEKEKLTGLSEKLKIGSRVFFPGFQKNPFKFIKSADVFALSSRWEGFGNVIVEAMACGVPVVSTNCPSGPGEIITDGKNGLLVDVADVKGMSEAILKLLRDRKLAGKIAREGKRRAEDFRVEKMVREYEKLFEK